MCYHVLFPMFKILNIDLNEIWRVLSSWLFFFSLENEAIILVHISFDGNNIENTPNLMTDDTFKRIKTHLKRNIVSYINIVYSGNHEFQKCDINRNAVHNLKSLSKKETRDKVQKRIIACLLLFVVCPIAFFPSLFYVFYKFYSYHSWNTNEAL